MSKKHYTGYSIDKRGNSFRIRITYEGKTYTYTYKAPAELTDSKQYAAAEKEAMRLREKLIMGYSSIIPTFRAYSDYIIDLKAKTQLKRSTINQYRHLIVRLNEEFGDMRLDTISPLLINQFYIKLANSPLNTPSSGIANSDKLINYIKERNITFKEISDNASVGINTVSLAFNGTSVSILTIEKICNYLHIDKNEYFTIKEQTKTISSKTIRHHIRLLSLIFEEAIKERIIDFNPVSATTLPKLDKKEVNYYQPEEIVAILDALKSEDLKWQLIISLLIVTGCRRGEIAGLRWESILWEHNLLHINQEVLADDNGVYIEDGTKNLDEKYVQVDDETMNLLRIYKQQFDENMAILNIKGEDLPQYLFYQVTAPEKPMHPSAINRFLTRFSSKNGFRPINPHSFRHSLASALIADGVDIYAVSKQLGHKQVGTTREIYTHQILEHQAKVAERIPQIYKRKE